MTVALQFQNQLLLKMSLAELAPLGALTKVDLPLHRSLELAGAPVEYVYFLESGLASVVEDVEGKGAVEVGVVGLEGMTGSALIFGDPRTPFATFMQCEGSAMRIGAQQLRIAVSASPTLRDLLLLYARSFTIQVATTAFANGRSSLVERLARWLLMVGDRIGDDFHITHEFLSTMLAVRRSGVTEGLQSLEGMGFIRSGRGRVEIIARAELIAFSQGSYGLAEKEYRRLLG
jgi:CRP-like cAMP-binding protein